MIVVIVRTEGQEEEVVTVRDVPNGDWQIYEQIEAQYDQAVAKASAKESEIWTGGGCISPGTVWDGADKLHDQKNRFVQANLERWKQVPFMVVYV